MDAPRDDDPSRRELLVEILTRAVIRYLTETTEPKSSQDSPTVPQSGLSSSANDRSL